jgi:general bacterial porin, GBP family
VKLKQYLLLPTLGIVATLAHAQSSVTLYGSIDDGFDYISNVGGHANYVLASNYQQLGSRWGLKGTEDLGGGLSTVFKLENYFSVNNGSSYPNGQMFGRQAYVGISSNNAGTLTLGRQYDSVDDYVAPLSAAANWGGTLFAHPFDADNLNETFSINNAAKYTSADYAGLQFGGVYGFSNQAGAFSNNRAWSLGARYRNGPLAFAAAFTNLDDPSSNTSGATTNTPYLSTQQRVAAAGANYTFGPAVFGAVYTHTDIVNRPTTPVSTLKFDNFEVNAKYNVTAAVYLAAMYVYTTESITYAGGRNDPHRNELGLMADYALSKRTDVYVQGVYEKASGNQVFGQIGDLAESTSQNQSVARVGIRTSF